MRLYVRLRLLGRKISVPRPASPSRITRHAGNHRLLRACRCRWFAAVESPESEPSFRALEGAPRSSRAASGISRHATPMYLRISDFSAEQKAPDGSFLAIPRILHLNKPLRELVKYEIFFIILRTVVVKEAAKSCFTIWRSTSLRYGNILVEQDFKRFHKSLIPQEKKWNNKCDEKIRIHIYTLVAMFGKDGTFSEISRFLYDCMCVRERVFPTLHIFEAPHWHCHSQQTIEARDFEIGQAYDSREDFHIRSAYFDKRKIFVTLLYLSCIEPWSVLTSALYSFCLLILRCFHVSWASNMTGHDWIVIGAKGYFEMYKLKLQIKKKLISYYSRSFTSIRIRGNALARSNSTCGCDKSRKRRWMQKR